MSRRLQGSTASKSGGETTRALTTVADEILLWKYRFTPTQAEWSALSALSVVMSERRPLTGAPQSKRSQSREWLRHRMGKTCHNGSTARRGRCRAPRLPALRTLSKPASWLQQSPTERPWADCENAVWSREPLPKKSIQRLGYERVA